MTMPNPFTHAAAPGAPDPGPRPRDLEGCLVAYSPTGFTAAGAPGNDKGVAGADPRDRVTTDLLILDIPAQPRGPFQPHAGIVCFGGSPEWEQDPAAHYLYVGAPARFTGLWLSNTTIVRALAPNGQPLTGQMVLGRIQRSTVGNKPYNLVAVAGTPDEQLAMRVWQQISTVNPETGQPLRPLQTPQPIPGTQAPQRQQAQAAPAAPMPPANSVQYGPNFPQAPAPAAPVFPQAPAAAPQPQQPWADPAHAAIAASFPGAQPVGGAPVPGLFPGAPAAPAQTMPQPPAPVAPAAAPEVVLPPHLTAAGWTPQTWGQLSTAQQSQVLANTPLQ